MFRDSISIPYLSVIYALMFIALPTSSSIARDKPGDEKVMADGKKYTQYKAVAGDTPYSIAKKSGVTLEELNNANPGIMEKLNTGQMVKIPYLKGNTTKNAILGVPDANVLSTKEKGPGELKFAEYQIVEGDNYFQLEKRFGVKKTELEQMNPSLKEGINIGTTIKIPIKQSAGLKSVEDNNPPNSKISESLAPGFKSSPNKTFEIGVFLPFCQNLDDSSKLAQRTALFLEFYSGVILATEKVAEAGMKVKLYVYDTYQDPKVIEKLVKSPEFLTFDLIIGPVYPENQKTVTELSAKNHIPMVSPLSTDDRFVSTTPGYYQVNPSKSIRFTATADYIVDKFVGQNIILLDNGTSSGDEKLIIDRLIQKPGIVKIKRCNIWAEGTAGLEGKLRAGEDNIIVLTEGKEANVSIAMTRLNTLSKTYTVTLIGLQEYSKMQSIDIEYLHNTRLHYLSPYFIDYGNPKVNAFVEKYRNTYYSEPTQYSFQGYDNALYFLATLAKYGKIPNLSRPLAEAELLQAGYSFRHVSPLGGYMNQTFYVIEYTEGYEVKTEGKFQGTVPESAKH